MITADQASAAALAEWQQAKEHSDRWYAWQQAHPDAKHHELEEWEREQGMPRWGLPGRLTVCGYGKAGYWYVRLSQPTPWGSYCVQCRDCGQLALRHHVQEGGGLCHDCRAPMLERRKAVQAERRIERRRRRSAELANRRGLCRVCGSEMTVARGSKITCSDRCRKQWIRKGEEAFPLPEAPTEIKIGTMDPLPLAVAHERVFNRLMSHIMTRETKRNEPDPVADDLRRILDQIIHIRSLGKLRESAPAVFLLELSRLSGSAAPEPATD